MLYTISYDNIVQLEDLIPSQFSNKVELIEKHSRYHFQTLKLARTFPYLGGKHERRVMIPSMKGACPLLRVLVTKFSA